MMFKINKITKNNVYLFFIFKFLKNLALLITLLLKTFLYKTRLYTRIFNIILKVKLTRLFLIVKLLRLGQNRYQIVV